MLLSSQQHHRDNVPRVLSIASIVDRPTLAHKVVHEARVMAEVVTNGRDEDVTKPLFDDIPERITTVRF